MYPYILIFGLKIYSLSIGIVISILVFIFLTKLLTSRHNLNFWKFFNYVPIILILPYILGRYFYLLINDNLSIIFPSTISEILKLLSPYGFEFNFIGISLGLFISLLIFLNSIQIKSEIYKRIDILFFSLCFALIPLGLFLLLGDTFLGIKTNSLIGIRSLIEDSALSKFDKVYPIGLFVSFISLGSFLITFCLQFIIRKYGLGFIGFIILIFSFNFVFIFQNYPRKGSCTICNVGESKIDIKNYWTFILILGIIIYYSKININENKISKKG